MKTIFSVSYRQPRKGYTLIEFIALLIIIAIVIGMLIPAVQAAREASRRNRCTNNLKEIGRSIHEFHQSQKALPPICLFVHRPAIFSLLLPYLHYQELYDKMVADGHFRKAEAHADPKVVISDRKWFVGLEPAEKAAFASITTFLCPNRHQAPAMTLDLNVMCAGPLADYAGLVVTIDGKRAEWHHFSAIGANERYRRNFEVSPLRLPTLAFCPELEKPGSTAGHSRSIMNWSFTDKMDRWADGTSNQFIFAEKHIPKWAINGDTTEKASWDGGWHCVFFATSAGNTARLVPLKGNLRGFNQEWPPPNQKFENQDELQHLIGSAHPGILANVLVGDGSVRPLWLDMEPEMIWRLTHVKGIAIELP